MSDEYLSLKALALFQRVISRSSELKRTVASGQRKTEIVAKARCVIRQVAPKTKVLTNSFILVDYTNFLFLASSFWNLARDGFLLSLPLLFQDLLLLCQSAAIVLVAVQVGPTGLDRHSCDDSGLARLRACIYRRLLASKQLKRSFPSFLAAVHAATTFDRGSLPLLCSKSCSRSYDPQQNIWISGDSRNNWAMRCQEMERLS